MAVIQKDIISTIYKELFTVKFLHNGFGPSRQNFIADSIELEPDDETKKVFINHGIGYRFFTDTLICLIRTELLSPPANEPKVPYIKFSGDVRFRFLINATDDFFSKTDVVITGAKQVYQFTNQVNAGTGGFISTHSAGVNNDDLKNVDTVETGKPCFGVIDIYSNGAVNRSYDLFNAVTTQQLKSPAYSILFISKI